MRSQGWEPGDYLGAKNASHANLHTAANASHIRVLLKDDNLGIGAKSGGQRAGECTGLDVFNDLLGRLNGEDEKAIDDRREKREDAKRRLNFEGRWGGVRFVKGGWLVGDKIEGLIGEEREKIPGQDEKDAQSEGSDIGDRPKKGKKKRKRDGADVGSTPASEKKKSKKRRVQETEGSVAGYGVVDELSKKGKKRRKVSAEEETSLAEISRSEDTRTPKSKRRKDLKDQIQDSPEVIAVKVIKTKKVKKTKKRLELDVESARLKPGDTEATSDKAVKIKKRTEPKPPVEVPSAALSADPRLLQEPSTKRKKVKQDISLEASDNAPQKQELLITHLATPPTTLSTTSSGRSTPITGGRHAVRSRNIAQKRLACMDATALNQIFMVKGSV